MTLLAATVLLAMLALVSFNALAGPDRGPFDPALLATYLWVVGISVLGGVASFYVKVKRGQARAFNLAELVGEIVTSAVAGLITFWLCTSASLSPWLTAAFVGIAGHMGSRALFLLEKVLERWLDRFGVSAPGTASAREAEQSQKG